jgi:protein-disulfide isomerase
MRARAIVLALLMPILFGLSACGDGSTTGPTIAELMVESPLGDKWIGRADAPVTIIEYASMTCPHCRAFHETVFDDFVAAYVDTGKVRFIFREFPLDNLAKAGAMLARCTPGENGYFAMVDVLFETQTTWATAENPADALLQIAQQAGFTQESFEACLSNQELDDGVDWSFDRGVELGVTGTPTFFINGEMFSGEISLVRLSQIVDGKL